MYLYFSGRWFKLPMCRVCWIEANSHNCLSVSMEESDDECLKRGMAADWSAAVETNVVE